MFAPSDTKKVASVTECFPLSLLSVTLRAGKHKSLVILNEKEMAKLMSNQRQKLERADNLLGQITVTVNSRLQLKTE